MKKALLCVVLTFLLLGGIYFVSEPCKAARRRIWLILDKDVVRLKNGDVKFGWIWGEAEDNIIGKTEHDEVFTIGIADCQRIEENLVLQYLDKIL